MIDDVIKLVESYFEKIKLVKECETIVDFRHYATILAQKQGTVKPEYFAQKADFGSIL
jgi:hypothetical protein